MARVTSGYSGGRSANPSYNQVCSGVTGHAEVVRVEFDKTKTSYEQILLAFFRMHDPTTVDQQGPDRGSQYRSVVFYADEQQKAVAEAMVQALTEAKVFPRPIVTAIEPLGAFYAAEEEHMDYYSRNSDRRYCRAVIAPKLQAFRAKYASS